MAQKTHLRSASHGGRAPFKAEEISHTSDNAVCCISVLHLVHGRSTLTCTPSIPPIMPLPMVSSMSSQRKHRTMPSRALNASETKPRAEPFDPCGSSSTLKHTTQVRHVSLGSERRICFRF